MGTVQELQIEIKGSSEYQNDATHTDRLPDSSSHHKRRWLLLTAGLCTVLVIIAQTAATLLGRFYYNQGGNSKWLATLVSTAGFPILFIFLLLPSPAAVHAGPPTTGKIIPIYVGLGLLIAGDNLMYSYGLLYIPVSTFALLCSTQLAFNAVSSYFLNSQKFTPHILNSVVLLTFSAAILGVSPEPPGSTGISKGKYPLGFMLTLAASAMFSLILSLMQLTFQKVLKRETFHVVIEMLIWTGFVATAVAVAGLFASGDWRGLGAEMGGFKKGRASYVMTLVSIAVLWQVYGIGAMGLTYAVSSLFSNMVCTFALPLVPIFAVIFFHDKMDGLKVIAILIAVWGFCSYMYQDYLDCSRAKNEMKSESSSSGIQS